MIAVLVAWEAFAGLHHMMQCDGLADASKPASDDPEKAELNRIHDAANVSLATNGR